MVRSRPSRSATWPWLTPKTVCARYIATCRANAMSAERRVRARIASSDTPKTSATARSLKPTAQPR